MLAAADTRLTEVRRHVPDAGGLVIATDQTSARAYAAHAARITGEAPTVVLSDDAGAERRIEAFAAGDSRWMVAVRMVSEGVDVPRLCVGVYATSTSTPLFFAQAVGRFVRARRRGETASVFLPSVPVAARATPRRWRTSATTRSTGRRPTRPRPRCGPRRSACSRRPTAPSRPSASTSSRRSRRWSPRRTFDQVLFDAQQFGCTPPSGSEEEQDFLGLPGLLEPDQVATLLHERQAKQTRAAGAAQARGGIRAAPVSAHRALAAQRKELNKLVAAYASQDRQPAREHPHRPASRVRRARAGGRHERAGARAGGADPALVRRPPLTVAGRHRTFTDWPVARRAPGRMPG